MKKKINDFRKPFAELGKKKSVLGDLSTNSESFR